ncbi:hypothetical protein LTR91_006904 [Friedmanniomyces endolithicus]|uniref:Uncharacterized protein n=1 Tax=Friedmanniomyces endolithicus TaxID=329885 RepID=A0AAN6KRX6_9PEZI|nr:hypothetical protein LTR59_015628 [Friedmanniomyces endolithicus]KAK0773291.1 hypothetical protein LTR38_016626 [Friedmanniomyces endolithicus]KAK0838727.1 hypothetical protein LTR03_011813 [Friedmanniomyces endolithicus]KAK0859136.1 hypothetical protein LTS02_009410 [Friedmanniomyces endolithicus]KAK0873436.1 hypothetical protein LTR87_011939 [Friedmanniomyces endolithicus]
MRAPTKDLEDGNSPPYNRSHPPSYSRSMEMAPLPAAYQPVPQAEQEPQAQQQQLQQQIEELLDLLRQHRLHQKLEHPITTHSPAILLWLAAFIYSFIVPIWNGLRNDPFKQSHITAAKTLQISCIMLGLGILANWGTGAAAAGYELDTWRRRALFTLRSLLGVVMMLLAVAMALTF